MLLFSLTCNQANFNVRDEYFQGTNIDRLQMRCGLDILPVILWKCKCNFLWIFKGTERWSFVSKTDHNLLPSSYGINRIFFLWSNNLIWYPGMHLIYVYLCAQCYYRFPICIVCSSINSHRWTVLINAPHALLRAQIQGCHRYFHSFLEA